MICFELLERINGTLIWYYYICHREVWLIGHSIASEQDNDFMVLGRHIHEMFYKNSKKEFLIDNKIKIDVISKEKIIGEIKKSSKYLKSARMQLAFYLYYMKTKGINMKGELLIPEERKREQVVLTPEIEQELELAIEQINNILKMDIPPKAIKIPYCKNCAYKHMCWS